MPVTSTTRCVECHASIPVPTDLAAVAMRCEYCGREQPVPDLAARRHALVAEQREARLLEERRTEVAARERREAAEAREKEGDRKEARGHRWRTGLISMFAVLIAPTVIAITVFDLPARLGIGKSGSDRLEQMQAQLAGTGCTVLEPLESEFADSNVSRLIAVDHQCLRVLAAGGSGHSSLSLRLFAADGTELGHADDTTDPQLSYCSSAKQTPRYEIQVGPASKGRLSHLTMSCPDKRDAPPTPKPKR